MLKILLSIFAGLFLVVLLASPLAFIKVSQIQAMIAAGEQGQPPTAVSAFEVTSDVWPQTLRAVGSVTAVNGAAITSEVPGIITEIAFTAGAEVRAGDLIVRLEDSVERAQLAQAAAELSLAEKDLARARDLFQRKTIPQSDLDTAESRLASASAAVAAREAMLAKKRIVAPFDGRLGLRRVSLGQFLNPGQAIVELQSISPIYVEFSLPQRTLNTLREGLEIDIIAETLDAPMRGELTAIASQVDAATRNVRLQATLANPEGLLRPGMFAKVEVLLPEAREILVIPQTAVLYAAYGDSVFIIQEKDGDLVAEQAFIRRGERRGDFVEVTEGLSLGQRVVKEGGFKISNGATLSIENGIGASTPELAPTPANE